MSSAPTRAGSRRAAGAVGLAVSAVLVAAIVWWASRQQAPSLPTDGGDLAELGLAVALYFAACLVRGERWQILLVENGARPRRIDTYALIAVGYLGNNVLPARAGDALRVVLVAPRAHTDARTVIGTLVAERLADVLVLATLFLVLAYTLASGAGADVFGDRLGVALGVLAVVLAVLGLVALVLHRTGRLRGVLAFLRPMAAATMNLRGRHGAEVLVLSVVVWAIEGVVWWLVGEASGLDVSIVEAAYLLALASMLSLIPSGPGYAGTMDAAILLGAKALDRTNAAGLSYLILLRFVLMVPICTVGLVVGIARYGGLRRLRTAAASQ